MPNGEYYSFKTKTYRVVFNSFSTEHPPKMRLCSNELYEFYRAYNGLIIPDLKYYNVYYDFYELH